MCQGIAGIAAAYENRQVPIHVAPVGPKMMIRMLPARDHKKIIGCALGVGAPVLYLRRAARPVGTMGKSVGTNSCSMLTTN